MFKGVFSRLFSKRGNLFACVFFLFNLSLILPVPKLKSKLGVKCLFLVCNFCFEIFIIIFHSEKSYMFLTKEKFMPMSIANAFMTFICIVHRIILRWRLHKLKQICNQITDLCEFLNLKISTKIYFFKLLWIVQIVITAIILIVLSFAVNLELLELLDFSRGSKNNSYHDILSCIFGFTFITFHSMPVFIFSVYYSLVCCHIEMIATRFRKSFESCSATDYHRLYKNLQFLHENVNSFNHSLEFIVFCHVLFNSCAMYFAITYIIHTETYGNITNNTSILLLCCHSFACFLYMIRSAIAVNDTFQDISTRAKRLPVDTKNNFIIQMRFHSDVEKEISMKIWGFGSIKRSFILASFGTIFTYCVLVDSITNMKRKENIKSVAV